MLRKTLIAIAAAGTMALGIGAGTAPANAKVVVFFGAGPYWGHHHSSWHCHYKKVKVWNKWHTKKIWVSKKTYCHSVWH